MRCSRMRGYGSWCLGWKEAERNPGPPQGNGGCGTVAVCGFVILIALSSFKVALETGSGMAVLIGIAVIAGLAQGLTKK